MKVDPDLAGGRAPERLRLPGLGRGKAGPGRLLVEAVQEGEGRLLVLERVAVLVVTLRHADPVGVAEAPVEAGHLVQRLARALDGHEVLHRRGDEERPRIDEEQQAGVVDSLRHQPVRVLLGIGVGVLEDAVGHPHGQRGDVAGRDHDRDARVEGADPRRLQPAPAGARDGDAVGIDLAADEEVVHGPQAVPHFPAQQAGPREHGQVAEHGVLAAHQVVAAAPALDVPELAALALAHRVPAEHHIPSAGQPDGDLLVGRMGLADRRVAAGEQHRRPRPRRGIGDVEERGDVEAGQALEHDLLDAVAVAGDRSRDARGQGRALGGQPTDEVDDLPAQVGLQREEVGFAAHGGEPLAAGVVLGPRPLELEAQVGRDAGPGGGPSTVSISAVGRSAARAGTAARTRAATALSRATPGPRGTRTRPGMRASW